jgi:hypothetical protein
MAKRIHVRNAKRLLQQNDEDYFRYAALELRLAIEAIAYEKLRLYAPRLPGSVLDKWQPPQAFRALEEYEPRSIHSFRLRIAKEIEPGVPGPEWHELGEHRSFDLRWLRKTYNKLGGLIHKKAPSYSGNSELSSIRDPKVLRAELEAILTEVDRVASSTIDGTLAEVFEFQCTVCDAPIIRSADGARQTQRCDCIQADCGAQHHVHFDEGGDAYLLLIATSFECLKCNETVPIENRKLDVGYEFSCSRCHSAHRIVTKQWGYATIESLDTDGV